MAPSRNRHATTAYLLSAILCANAGCKSDETPNVYPVEGRLFVAGMPAGSANVFFFPCDPNQPRSPVAVTAADGTFRLTTLSAGDGAPAGDYDVTVVWPDYSIPRDECVDPLHDRLKLQYADRSKTTLHASVRPGKNEIVLQADITTAGWSLPQQGEPRKVESRLDELRQADPRFDELRQREILRLTEPRGAHDIGKNQE